MPFHNSAFPIRKQNRLLRVYWIRSVYFLFLEKKTLEQTGDWTGKQEKNSKEYLTWNQQNAPNQEIHRDTSSDKHHQDPVPCKNNICAAPKFDANGSMITVILKQKCAAFPQEKSAILPRVNQDSAYITYRSVRKFRKVTPSLVNSGKFAEEQKPLLIH